MHGGMSPGAPTANRNAVKHGPYTADAIARFPSKWKLWLPSWIRIEPCASRRRPSSGTSLRKSASCVSLAKADHSQSDSGKREGLFPF